MNRSPTAASPTPRLRDAPGAAAMSGLLIRSVSWEVPTSRRVELIDVTPRLREDVQALAIREGVVHVWSLHTTCAVFVTESQEALGMDIVQLLESLAPNGVGWRHDDPRYSDCDRRNADAHLRALLLGQSVALPIGRGELVLGQWQRVLLGEMDGPRARTLYVQASGVE